MDHVNDADIAQLAKTDTVATLVPGANYFLGLREYSNARRLIDAGVALALATDYNPGTSPTVSMPMAMSLACTHMKMSPRRRWQRRQSMVRMLCELPEAKAASNLAKTPTSPSQRAGLSRDSLLVRG